MAKKKFDQIWKNQTELGKKFGISAIAVGKILTEHGLKDQQTKQATQRALDEGYAESTPLKDGTPYFMWNIRKVKQIIAQEHTQLNIVDYWVNEVRKNLKKAERRILWLKKQKNQKKKPRNTSPFGKSKTIMLLTSRIMIQNK